MRKLYALVIPLIFLSQFAFGQCPPPGFPQSGNTCPQAPILCENLDGYCNTINNNNQQQGFPGCGGNYVLNNDEWFAFYAGSTSISIQVTPTNCSGNGNSVGLQGGIYNGCGGPVMDVQCACSDDPFILSANNYVIGQIYWFVLDGCAGDVCDYSIDVLSGSTVGAPPSNPDPITGPDPICAGTSGTYAVPVVTGATIYNWTITPPGMGTMSGGNNQDVNIAWGPNANGQAQVCLSVANACYVNPVPVCTTITVLPVPSAVLTGGGVICAGSGATVPLTVTFTGVGPWVFTPTLNGAPQPPITTSDNPYTFPVGQIGTWGITNVHPVGLTCSGTETGTAVVTQPTITPTATTVAAICGQSNGSIDLSVTGGTAPYQYNWSNSATSQDLTGIPAGTYIVTVTDFNTCTATLSVTVADNPINIQLTGTTMPNTVCNSSNNGSINLSVAPAGTYTYNWSNSATTEDINNLAPGSYTVTVTTGLTCTATATFTIADQPNNPNPTFTTVQTTCDLSNGSINLSVTGGVAPYTFLWSNSATSEDLSNIPAGGYSVTVTGANGCTAVASPTVSNNNPPINITNTVMPNTNCNGTGNGSINISVTPAGTYTYNWSNSATTEDLTGLLPGGYTVTVSGPGSCSATATINVPDQPLEPAITYTTVQTTCDLSNGSIDVSVTGGTTPYTYAWGNSATTQDLNNIPAGSYSLTVTGANGCTDDATITVSNNNPPINVTGTVVANTTCNGSFNGSISATVNPPGTYTYLWSNAATTLSQTGLAAGSYTLTVTGQGSCSQVATFVVPENANVPIVIPSASASTCDLPNGNININVAGSVPPFTYNWSNSATTQSLTNVLSGSYTLTVTGANGCSTVTTIDLQNFNPPINVTASIINNNTCINGNGSIDVTVTPANTYTYNWSNSATTQDINNLLPGDYTVTVSAGGTCTAVQTFTVNNAPNAPIPSFTQVDASCGLSNGSINLSVAGGVLPYTYQWNNSATTQDLSNITGDAVYTVTITGGNGCTTVEGVVLNNYMIPLSINAQVLGKTSCITNNGSITISVTPAAATILWDNNSTAPTRSNLAPGSYSVTVSMGGTCTETATFEVYEEVEYPALSAEITPGYCSLPNGSIDLIVEGGAAPYTYKWASGATTEDLANKLEGTYSVTVTTALGCTAETSIFLPNNDIPIQLLETVYDNISCVPPSTGAIDINVEPSGYPYSFSWSTGSTQSSLSNIVPGTYTVTVKLGNSCTASGTYTVINAAVSPNISASAVPAICGLTNGGANLSVSGASSPYTFQWSNMATTQNLSNVAPGNYTVTVTDFFACSATTAVAIANNNVVLNITGTPTENTSCAAANGAINISVTPAGTYTYSWSNTATTEDLSGLAPGTYSVTVSAGSSCSSTASFIVGNNTSDPVLAPAITAAICSNPNGAIDMSVSGAQTPYVFSWSNSATTEDLSGILPGTYSVTVTGANGCVSDTILFVPNNSSTFSLAGVVQSLTDCATPNGAVDLTVTPAGPYTYEWSHGPLTQDVSTLPAGIYTVSVTETGTCTASISFIIPDDRSYPTTSQVVAEELCNLENGSINLTVSGGVTPYTFSWDSGQTTEDLNNIHGGAYAVTVTGANHCTATASMNVPDNSVAFSIAGVPTDNSSCVVNNGAVNVTVSPADPGSGLSYTYQWSNTLTTEDLFNLSSGLYAVTVSAGGTCTSTASYNVGNNTLAPSIGEIVSAAFCGQSSGGVDVTVTGGEAPYTYLWSTQSTLEDLTGVASGNYSVTVTGSNGCTSVDAYVIPENTTIPAVTGTMVANTSCVSNNGSITLNVTPVLTYTYQWGGGQMTPNLQNIAGGNYSVTVNGGGSCIASASFNVPSDVAIVTLSGSTTNVLCFGGNNGAINLNVNGGTAPLTYAWSPAAGNVEDLTNLSAGAYSVTVTDVNGCSGSTTFNITQPANSLQLACSNVNDISSPTSTDGTGSVNISGGTAPYNVVWSPGSSQANVIPGVFTFNNLDQGSYQVSVTDANGCPADCGFNIGLVGCTTAVGTMGNAQMSLCGTGCITANYSALGQVLDPNDQLQFVLHEGSGNQIVNEIARSSQPSFCFNQMTMDYGTTYYISAIAGNADPSGNVQINAYCSVVSAPTPIVFYEKPVAAIAQPAALDCIDRQVNLVGSSNLPGATYNWTTVGGILVGSVTQANAIAGKAGPYTLTISVNSCKDTADVVVTDISNNPVATILATPDDLLDCVISEITLAGTAEGTFNANTIWISDNGSVYTPGTILQIEEPGTYHFTILDTLTHCADTAVIVINEDLAYPPLFLDPPGFLTCLNSSVTLTGGSPFPGISFSWITISGTDTTQVGTGTSLNVTTPNTYWLVGYDPVNQCINSDDVVVNANQVVPVADAGTGFSIKCFGETATLDGTGSHSVGNINFLWTTANGNFLSGTNTSTPLISKPGTYVLLVTDPANGCTDSDQVLINPIDPTALATVNQPPCYGDKGSIRVDEVNGGKAPIKFSLNDGPFTTQSAFLNLNAGVYTLIVQDAEGCSTTLSAEIIEPAEFQIIVAAGTTIALGDSFLITTQINNLPPTQDYTVQWTPSNGLACDTCLTTWAKPFTSTQYKVVVETEAGCRDDGALRLLVNRRVDVYIPNVFTPGSDDADNSMFTIYAAQLGIAKIHYLQVYSRWGELLWVRDDFQPNDPSVGWDGSYKGQPMNPGVYVYHAKIEFIDGRQEIFKGDVTVVR